MNLLSNAETVKGKRTLSKATRLCSVFPSCVPKKGQQKETELLGLDGFFSLVRHVLFQDFPLDKPDENCDTSHTRGRRHVLHTTNVRQLGNWFCFYLRLLRSRSSVSKSRRGCGVSLGPCDCSTEELEEMTVVWPEGWMVLNWN